MAVGGQLLGERGGAGQLAGRECTPVRHPHAGRARDLAAERLARLDPGGDGRGPEDRNARRDQGIGDPGGERRLRSDDDQLARVRARRRDHRGRIERIHPGEPDDPRLGGDRVAARRHGDLVHARLREQLPGQGVLATAGADDQDAGRHHRQAHQTGDPRLAVAGAAPGTVGRWRIGR